MICGMGRKNDLIAVPGQRPPNRDALAGVPRLTRWREASAGRGAGLRLPMRPPGNALLAGLGVGGLGAIHLFQFARDAGGGGVFGYLSLAFLALAAVVLILELVTKLVGSERVAIADGMMAVRVGVGPIGRTWRYRVEEIYGLQKWAPEKKHRQNFWQSAKTGAVYFEYRHKEVWIARELDEDEGAQVVKWLKPRLPPGACLPEW